MSRHSSAFTLMKRGLREPRRIPPYLGGLLADIPELTRYEPVFKLALRLQGANLSPELPTLYHHSRTRVLQSEDDVDAALRAVRSLGLHPHPTDAKNWDAFLVLRSVLKHTNPESAVLDAGGAPYSPLVEWLYLYGYRDLHVYNIDLERDFSRGPIQYINSDFTDTEFGDEGFDVITSLSVIEHGVSLEPMLQEFHRLLTPGGRLLVSTDFWPEKRATADVRTTYGESTQEWTIFDDSELESFVSLAKSVGFTLKGEAKFEDDEPVVEYFDREFTFALLEFVRE